MLVFFWMPAHLLYMDAPTRPCAPHKYRLHGDSTHTPGQQDQPQISMWGLKVFSAWTRPGMPVHGQACQYIGHGVPSNPALTGACQDLKRWQCHVQVVALWKQCTKLSYEAPLKRGQLSMHKTWHFHYISLYFPLKKDHLSCKAWCIWGAKMGPCIASKLFSIKILIVVMEFIVNLGYLLNSIYF